MAPRSAGILLYRHGADGTAVLLVHPGGPFWRRKQAGAWQIPKGMIEAGEAPLRAALREFEEELGHRPVGEPVPLGAVRQAGGKIVEAFALQGELDVTTIRSNHFELEWPPRSGRRQSFPEVDAARWFSLPEAEANMLPSQAPLLARLQAMLQATLGAMLGDGNTAAR